MTAPEPTPLELAAEAMHDQRCSGDGACDHGGRFEQLASLALTAALAGDWLERAIRDALVDVLDLGDPVLSMAVDRAAFNVRTAAGAGL